MGKIHRMGKLPWAGVGCSPGTFPHPGTLHFQVASKNGPSACWFAKSAVVRWQAIFASQPGYRPAQLILTYYSRQRLYPTLICGDSFKNDITFQPKLKYDFPLSNILKMVVSWYLTEGIWIWTFAPEIYQF